MHKTDLLVSIGRRIKTIRFAKKMTQNDLAIECDFEKASLSRIESGKTNITIRTLYKISKGLDVNIAEFFRD